MVASLLALARLMKAAAPAFKFSSLPPQALRALACRALPYEKDRFQGLHDK